VLAADSYRLVVAAVALGAVLLLALGVVLPAPSLLPWPLVVLAGLYAWTLVGDNVDQWAPVYAGGFLGVAELAYWSTELRGGAQDAEQLTERRAALIVTLSLVAVAAGALVLAATSVPIGGGVAIDALGVVAAVAALAVVAGLARATKG
jgi:hypothetical protein